MKKVKICHLTTVHPPFDHRIFYKECKTLVEAGYEVYLVVTNNKDEQVDGVNIIALPQVKNRLERMIKKTRLAYKKALSIDAQIYHFHDPELIPVGILLKMKGKKVVYDVHEDVPQQIISKSYLPFFIKPGLSIIFDCFEKKFSRYFDIVITSTDYISNLFLKKRINSIAIKNYVEISKLKIFKDNIRHKKKISKIVFMGGIYEERGLLELIKAINILKYETLRVLIYGSSNEKYIQKLFNINKTGRIEYKGYIERNFLYDELSNADIGYICDYPYPRHKVGLPVKLFEYMSAGLPVIASNFPLWKDIVEGNHCGICVDPLNPQEIAEAIRYLVNNPDIAQKMGENGRKAVLEKYNWENEAKKLLSIYEKLLQT